MNQKRKYPFSVQCQVHSTSESHYCQSYLHLQLRTNISLFLGNHRRVINKFIHMVWEESSRKLSFISWSLIFLKASSIWKLLIPSTIFYNQKEHLHLFFFEFFRVFSTTSLATSLATSDSSAFFKFLFSILEVAILYSSGACFVSPSISYLPISEVIALELTSSPFLKNFFASNFILRFVSFLSPLLKRLPPFCARLVRRTVTFLGKFLLFVLSYVATKVSPLGNVICLAVARLLSIIVFLMFFCIFFFFYRFKKNFEHRFWDFS